MPELPEVQTTVDGLNKTVVRELITDVWTDIAVAKPSLAHHATTTKSAAFFAEFKDAVLGRKIIEVERKAKNILIHLSRGTTILIHMKMTGHMMYGTYEYDEATKQWIPAKKEKNDALRDPFNRFLHTVFILSNGKHLVFSDMRKFATVSYLKTADIAEDPRFKYLGPEPLDESFTSTKFFQQLAKRPNAPIKQVLLDQTIISASATSTQTRCSGSPASIPAESTRHYCGGMNKLYEAMKSVLKKGIDFGGDSTSDYRDINGERGTFQGKHEAYRRTGQPCRKKGCKGTIVRIPFMGRGAHFCDTHQK
ncbi:MAG: DNA-formamidopyrimidine glycosylase family protein [bacterium]